jgi:hypothetical protein
MAKLPTVGYHITYNDRTPSIMRRGLLVKVPLKLVTGNGMSIGIHFIIDPCMSHWAARDRQMDTTRNWVIIKATRLNPKYIIEDEDFGETPEESIKNGGTFAYSVNINPDHLSIFKRAIGSSTKYHDEFYSLGKRKWKTKL